MKLHFLNEDALIFLKGNIETNLPQYQGDNLWVEKLCSQHGLTPFAEFKKEVPSITLDTSNPAPDRSD